MFMCTELTFISQLLNVMILLTIVIQAIIMTSNENKIGRIFIQQNPDGEDFSGFKCIDQAYRFIKVKDYVKFSLSKTDNDVCYFNKVCQEVKTHTIYLLD